MDMLCGRPEREIDPDPYSVGGARVVGCAKFSDRRNGHAADGSGKGGGAHPARHRPGGTDWDLRRRRPATVVGPAWRLEAGSLGIHTAGRGGGCVAGCAKFHRLRDGQRPQARSALSSLPSDRILAAHEGRDGAELSGLHRFRRQDGQLFRIRRRLRRRFHIEHLVSAQR